MLKIRLSRGGRKKLPYYRILVTNHTSPRDSKFLEKVGTYNPLLADDNEGRVTIKKDRVEYWLSVGAKPTERVAKFLISLGVKGAEKYAPDFTPKAKGSNLKKKALEKLAAEAEAKAEAEAQAAEEKAAAEAKAAEEKAAAEAKAAEEKAAAEAKAAEEKAAAAEAKKAEEAAAKEEAKSEEDPKEEAKEEPKKEEAKEESAS